MNFNTLFRIRRLEALFKQLYCEVKNNPDSGSGSSSGPRVITTADDQYNLSSDVITTIITFTEGSPILNLPNVSQTKGLIVLVTNAGTGPLTITSPDGIWEGGMNMESTSMDVGSTARIVNDGISYRINS